MATNNASPGRDGSDGEKSRGSTCCQNGEITRKLPGKFRSHHFVKLWCYFSRLMASFMPNNWKGHLCISVSKLCFKNAFGLLINNRSDFGEEWIIVQKMAATFQEEWIIAQKFVVNHQPKRTIIRKIAWIKTIGVTKMWENFIKLLFKAKFLWKATKSQIRLHYFCAIL